MCQEDYPCPGYGMDKTSGKLSAMMVLSLTPSPLLPDCLPPHCMSFGNDVLPVELQGNMSVCYETPGPQVENVSDTLIGGEKVITEYGAHTFLDANIFSAFVDKYLSNPASNPRTLYSPFDIGNVAGTFGVNKSAAFDSIFQKDSDTSPTVVQAAVITCKLVYQGSLGTSGASPSGGFNRFFMDSVKALPPNASMTLDIATAFIEFWGTDVILDAHMGGLLEMRVHWDSQIKQKPPRPSKDQLNKQAMRVFAKQTWPNFWDGQPLDNWYTPDPTTQADQIR